MISDGYIKITLFYAGRIGLRQQLKRHADKDGLFLNKRSLLLALPIVVSTHLLKA